MLIDPQAFVPFFEKLQANEKEKQYHVSKAFDTHRMMEDRVRRAEEEIAVLLPDKTEYVGDTGEFQGIKPRPVESTHPVVHRHDTEDEARRQAKICSDGESINLI